MENPIKSAIIQKNIEGALYDIMVRTNAENVEVEEGKSLKSKLSEMSQSIAGVITSDTVDNKIKAATTELYNKIMGITEQDGTAVNEAFDTLKEVAAWLANDSNKTAADIVTDITAVSDKVGAWSSEDNKSITDVVEEHQRFVDGFNDTLDSRLQGTLEDAEGKINEAVKSLGAVTYSTIDGDVEKMTEYDVHLKEATALD